MIPAQFLANPQSLNVSDIILGKNASKAAQITTVDGKTLTFKFGTQNEPLEAPFGLSSWEGASTDRVSLDLRATPEIEELVDGLDEVLVQHLEQNCKKYFGASMKQEKVREYFRPTIKRHEENKYPPLCKTKLSKSRVKVWGPDKEAASVEDITPHSEMCVVLTVRSLYFQSKGWGLTLECQHVGLANSVEHCPFEDVN